MKHTNGIIALAVFMTTPMAASAETRIAELCGTGHVNEAASKVDVKPNPVGFYVTSLGEQVSDRDVRVIPSAGDACHLCTRTAATPDMDASKALLLMQKRTVKYLFVPVIRRRTGPSY